MKPALLKFLFMAVCLALSLASYARTNTNIAHVLYEPYTHAENFAWMAGQLKYLGVEGPTWNIVYDQERNKKFLLLKAGYIFQPPADFKDGDMVIVTGRVAHMEMSSFMSGDYYEVDKIVLLEPHNAQVKLEQQQQLEQEQQKGKKNKS